MAEVNHELEREELEASVPAVPMTADLMLNLENQQRKIFGGGRVSCGCEILDGLFDGEKIGRKEGGGGVERGVVVGISADGKEGESVLISLNFLASLLIPYLNIPSSTFSEKPPKPIAQIVDTTGSFPLATLAKILKSRLLSSGPQRATARQTGKGTGNYIPINNQPEDEGLTGDEPTIGDLVDRGLEMIFISRVFDVEGLWEVLSEVNHSQQEAPLPPESKLPMKQSSPDWPNSAKKEVRDSESNSPLPVKPPQPPPPPPPPQEHQEDGLQILIIHTMTPLINDILSRREKSEAHTFLTTLSNTLHTLTHTNNILTILHNSTVPATSAYHQARKEQPSVNPKSIFTGATMKPALGQIFTQFIDLHLLISSLPKRRRDAEVLYGGDDEKNTPSKHVDYAYVAEVLKDETSNLDGEHRFGYREQSWVPLLINQEGTGFGAAIEDKGFTRGMALSREKGIDLGRRTEERAGLGVGNVAKIYGFGGRRV